MADDLVELQVPRRRLDAAALAAVAASAGVTACLVCYAPLTGVRNPIGPAAEQLARPLVDALGFGVWLLVSGAFALIVLYVLGRSWLRIGIRFAGWAMLAVVAAAVADRAYGWELPVVSAYGRGGAIGGFVSMQLKSLAAAPVPALLLALAGFLGVNLIADGLVRFLFRRVGTTLRGGNAWVGRRGDRALTFAKRQFQPKPIVLQSDGPPIVRHTGLQAPFVAAAEAKAIAASYAGTDVYDDTPIELPRPPLPIHRSTAPATATLLRVVSAETATEPSGYVAPGLELLSDSEAYPVLDHEQRLRERAALLEKTFTDFGLAVKVVGIHTGPVITQYEIALDTGLRLSKVTVLSDDLALCLGVPAVRIVAPLPGRNTVGIEVPNDHRQTVRLKELIQTTGAKADRFKLPIFLGKDVEGRPLVYDMAAMPHLLIAGRTGTGKSVCLNSIILSLLYSRTPDECRMIMIDPKKVELSEYGKVPHLMHPVITDDKKAEAVLAWAVDKMEERYELLRKARVRNIATFNELTRDEILRRIDPVNEDERAAIPTDMPYIVIIVDEVGDLIMSMKKEVEGHIIRLAQKSRAAGIHLILATQKPTVDVVTGLIKSNLPARICFQVATRSDSAVVLDEKGAEKLLGMGDMLFLQPGTSTIIRAQGAYVDDREIAATVEALECYEPNFENELLNLKAKDDAGGSLAEKLRDRDPLYEQAVEIVIREQRGSTSLLQRAMGIGYGKASRFIDFMCEDGIVGGYNGSNAREVLLTPEDWEVRRTG